MTEPTPEVIVAALERAKELVSSHNFELMAALAEATTTAQCHNVEGFKVFRDIRSAVTDTLPAGVSLPNFSDTASKETVMGKLVEAILVVKS